MKLPKGWMFMQCGNCGHLGFSHDNAQDCAECDCQEWADEDPEIREEWNG